MEISGTRRNLLSGGERGDLFEIYNDCKAEAINIVWGHTVPVPATQYSES